MRSRRNLVVVSSPAEGGYPGYPGSDGGPLTDPPGADPGSLARAADAPPARAAMEALRVGVLVLDADDIPVLANPAARDMGLVRGRGDAATDAHSIVRTLAGQVRRSGESREVELDLARPHGVGGGGGGQFGVHVRASALDEGHVVVEAADVTEAHRVARVRRDFVANVSHELKTPVGALQLLAEALLEATDPDDGDAARDPAAARRFAERIQKESTRLGRLVSELLELSRLQGAEPLPEPQPVSVDRIVAEVVDRTRTPASAKDIEVLFDGERELTVYGSESQLVTAVTNLVENAVAYSPEHTRVTVRAQRTDDGVEISVIDQGIGIEPRDLDRIFERFYRADKARSRATGGTGLGLAIVKHIATNHAGRVEVHSTVGVGSTFTLRLPGRPPEVSTPLPQSVEINPNSVV
ncbi:two-component sensor histidine kinase [Planosporangium thailandense]|uniref:Sensor-like histidine kinase SenX3 n=1 Tax=Planosporangium thailandense TaxID=765197 RepID=A0ABX0XV97_9ACTN|nr:ATP-binding protein [Planosporangium thailandense]NJC69310.1 two-component sensor histidine kinase [Planosporangium thailandense]